LQAQGPQHDGALGRERRRLHVLEQEVEGLLPRRLPERERRDLAGGFVRARERRAQERQDLLRDEREQAGRAAERDQRILVAGGEAQGERGGVRRIAGRGEGLGRCLAHG